MELIFSFIDRSNLQAHMDVINQVLKLQKSLITTRIDRPRAEGFLISSFSVFEVEDLIRQGGKLHAAHIGQDLMGYILLTDSSELTSLYSPGSEGVFCAAGNEMDIEKCVYLYQIAIDKTQARKGIGTQLLRRVLTASDRAIVTDVLTSPIDNRASCIFFERHGFMPIGTLKLGAYRDFGKLSSQVYLWNP